jgi:hypothetical protein
MRRDRDLEARLGLGSKPAAINASPFLAAKALCRGTRGSKFKFLGADDDHDN